jgi:DNA-binding transcriptional regulator YiaG
MLINSNNQIILNKSFQKLCFIETNPNFYQIIKNITAKRKKIKESTKSKIEIHKSNINVVQSFKNVNNNSNSNISDNDIMKTQHKNSNARPLSFHEIKEAREVSSVSQSNKSKLIFTFNSTFQKNGQHSNIYEERKSKSKSTSKKQRSTLESKSRFFDANKGSNKDNKSFRSKENLQSIDEIPNYFNNPDNIDCHTKRNKGPKKYENNTNIKENAYSFNKKDKFDNKGAKVNNYVKKAESDESNTLADHSRNKLIIPENNDSASFRYLKYPLRNNLEYKENFCQLNFMEIKVSDHNIIVLSVEGLHLVGIFTENTASTIQKLLLKFIFISICNFELHKKIFSERFLSISEINVAKLKIFENIYLKNLINHYFNCFNTISGFGEITYSNSVFSNYYLINLDPSWTASILVNLNKIKLKYETIDYLSISSILKEIMFHGIKLRDNYYESKNFVKSTDKQDFQQVSFL